MRTLLRAPTLLVVLAVACQSGPGRAEPAEQTRARIENRSSLDMDIFMRRNDGRAARLGFAPGDQTTTFALPPAFTTGASWIRFEARPVRGTGNPVVSEPFNVKMGDEITWSVPPQ
jgi:hypothetical protein